MQLIKKAFITNCILMAVCALCLTYDAVVFRGCYEMLHSGDWSSLFAIFVIPLFFLFSLASVIMGGIQISIAIRNIVKIRTWYTILMLVLSCVVLVAPIVLVLLLFLL